jgi:hypothetical protein
MNFDCRRSNASLAMIAIKETDSDDGCRGVHLGHGSGLIGHPFVFKSFMGWRSHVCFIKTHRLEGMTDLLIHRITRDFDVGKPPRILHKRRIGVWDFTDHGLARCALQHQMVVAVLFQPSLADKSFQSPNSGLGGRITVILIERVFREGAVERRHIFGARELHQLFDRGVNNSRSQVFAVDRIYTDLRDVSIRSSFDGPSLDARREFNRCDSGCILRRFPGCIAAALSLAAFSGGKGCKRAKL